jgi:hypothetical protein
MTTKPQRIRPEDKTWLQERAKKHGLDAVQEISAIRELIAVLESDDPELAAYRARFVRAPKRDEMGTQ